MATRNIPITYPDAAAPRIIAALKAHYGQVEDATTKLMRDRTNAEAFAAFEASVKDSLRHIVRMVEKEAAKKAAEATVTDAEVT